MRYISKGFLFFLIIIVFFCAYLQLNLLYPLYADDWTYLYITGSESEKIKNIFDILYSQYIHYFSWGGRTIVHIIAQFLLLLNPIISDILNSAVFVFLAYIICVIVASSLIKIKLSLFVLVCISLFLFVPEIGDTVFWITGSSNYLWGTVLTFSFLLPYILVFNNNNLVINKYVLFVYGIISGWTNENSGIILITFILILVIYCKKNNQKIPNWFYYGLIGSVIGSIILHIAPGNFIRTKVIFIEGNYAYLPYSYILKKNILRTYHVYINNMFVLDILYIILLVVFLKLKSKQDNIKAIFLSFLFLGVSHISLVITIIYPSFPDRASFNIVCLMITSIFILYSNVKFPNKLYDYIVCIVFICLFLFRYLEVYHDLNLINHTVKKRIHYIETEKSKGKSNIVIPDDQSEELKVISFTDITKDSTFWLNQSYARYSKVESIRLN